MPIVASASASASAARGDGGAVEIFLEQLVYTIWTNKVSRERGAAQSQQAFQIRLLVGAVYVGTNHYNRKFVSSLPIVFPRSKRSMSLVRGTIK